MFTKHALTVARRDDIRDPEVNSDLGSRSCQWSRRHVDAVHTQPPLRAFSLHGDRLRFAQEWSVIVRLDLTDAFQIESPVLKLHLPAASIKPLQRIKSIG